jgi:SAM-dependent methyltransferase
MAEARPSGPPVGEGHTAPVDGVLRRRDGSLVAGQRWDGEVSPADAEVLDHARPPVLDVGCGPARHAAALAERGLPSMGIDIAPPALDAARDRGVPVLQRGVFERIPASGRWGSALLLDGNVGLGGDPVALLVRVGSLLAPGGCVLAEVLAPGSPSRREEVRLELDGEPGPWFTWVTVDAEGLAGIAAEAGFSCDPMWNVDDRWFGVLERVGDRR